MLHILEIRRLGRVCNPVTNRHTHLPLATEDRMDRNLTKTSPRIAGRPEPGQICPAFTTNRYESECNAADTHPSPFYPEQTTLVVPDADMRPNDVGIASGRGLLGANSHLSTPSQEHFASSPLKRASNMIDISSGVGNVP